jgi:hypothetical protein
MPLEAFIEFTRSTRWGIMFSKAVSLETRYFSFSVKKVVSYWVFQLTAVLNAWASLLTHFPGY